MNAFVTHPDGRTSLVELTDQQHAICRALDAAERDGRWPAFIFSHRQSGTTTAVIAWLAAQIRGALPRATVVHVGTSTAAEHDAFCGRLLHAATAEGVGRYCVIKPIPLSGFAAPPDSSDIVYLSSPRTWPTGILPVDGKRAPRAIIELGSPAMTFVTVDWWEDPQCTRTEPVDLDAADYAYSHMARVNFDVAIDDDHLRFRRHALRTMFMSDPRIFDRMYPLFRR